MDFDLYMEMFNFVKQSAALEATILMTLIGLALVVFILVHIGPRFIFHIYETNTMSAVQLAMTKFVYSLDYLADEMSNKEKRELAIAKLQSAVTFRGLKLPRFIYGWVIDMLVANIREAQAHCIKESDLHHEESSKA